MDSITIGFEQLIGGLLIAFAVGTLVGAVIMANIAADHHAKRDRAGATHQKGLTR